MTAGRGPRVLFPAESIAARVQDMAREIAGAGLHDPVAVIILDGGFMFGADLLRQMAVAGVHGETDFLRLSSYGGGTHSTGDVKLVRDANASLAGRDVLLIDDILDTGHSLSFARRYLLGKGAGRVMTACLLDKGARRAVSITADFTGFQCPDVFVVGYGMDHAGRYRGLPFVGVPDGESD